MCGMEVGRCTSTPTECQWPREPEIMTNNWPWLSSACFACISKYQADLLGAQAWVFMCQWNSQCRGSSSDWFDFPLISHCYSPLYLHFTSYQLQVCVFVLSAPLILHPERAAAVALPPGCFHEGVGREGLACRYEQTVTTDGSGAAAVLPRHCCSLPLGWRPRPINPKPCHLFSSLWMQKESCEGSFTGFLQVFLLYVIGGCRMLVVSTDIILGDFWKKMYGIIKNLGFSEYLKYF